jgi:hypothetical protein
MDEGTGLITILIISEENIFIRKIVGGGNCDAKSAYTKIKR